MNTHARRWLAAAAVAATALTLAACDGSGEEPPTTPTTEATTEPTDDVTTADPSPTGQEIPDLEEPEAPPEMLVDDATGAVAATWYFLQLYDYSRATGSTALWGAMVTDECEWCAAVTEQVTDIYDDGGRIDAPGLTYDISTARVVMPDNEDPFYAVRLDVLEDAWNVVRNDGTVEEQPGQSLEPLAVAMQYQGGRFRVVAVNFAVG